MDFTKPLFSGVVATILGTLGTLISGASVMVPAPWTAPVAIAGFLIAALAGLGAKPPAFTEGKPILQGVALTVVTTLGTLLATFWTVIPAGWPQSIALAIAGLVAWLTGKAMPGLGATLPNVEPKPAAFVSTSAPVEIFNGPGR